METDEDQTRFYTTLDVNVEARNKEGVVVLANDREDYLELNPGEFEEVRTFPFSYQSNFPLLPGEYSVSVILKNRVSRQYTVAETDLVVPPSSSGDPILSNVILAYAIEALREDEAGEGDLRTFQLGSTRLRPAADGVFALGKRSMFPSGLGRRPDSQLHFALLEGEVVLQERVTALSAYLGGPIVERFPLRGMVGGRYAFRVRLLDPVGRVLAEQTANCQISPRTAMGRPWSRQVSFGISAPGLLAMARGDQFVAQGRLPEAKAEFEGAMASAGAKLPAARWKLASILIRTGEPARALELLTPVEQEYPNQYEVVAGLGLRLQPPGRLLEGHRISRARQDAPPAGHRRTERPGHLLQDPRGKPKGGRGIPALPQFEPRTEGDTRATGVGAREQLTP